MSDLGAFYTFDGNEYADDESGRQELLEALLDAITTDVYSQADLSTDAGIEEATEAINMSFDGTHYAGDFWSNIVSIMQMAPTELDVKRHPIDLEVICGRYLEASVHGYGYGLAREAYVEFHAAHSKGLADAVRDAHPTAELRVIATAMEHVFIPWDTLDATVDEYLNTHGLMD